MAEARATKDYSEAIAAMLQRGNDPLSPLLEARQRARVVLTRDLARRLRVPASVIAGLLETMPADDAWLLDDAEGRLILADTVADLLGRDSQPLPVVRT